MKAPFFNNYSTIFFKDKDHEAKTAYNISLIKKYSSGVKTILEFGSGTGIHGNLLAKKGYSVHNSLLI